MPNPTSDSPGQSLAVVFKAIAPLSVRTVIEREAEASLGTSARTSPLSVVVVTL
ncbi:hypothetical protein ACQPZ8_33410 [Actinomadura nitritigenes]|uniref:hypothetical protein n=1 Tax=Actinomadura nitritigenes TaxID=134602 RepID=UPI003D8F65EA